KKKRIGLLFKKIKKRNFFKKILFLFFFLLLGLGLYYLYHNYQILKQVHQYETKVEKAIAAENITDYKELALAIIFTETKGDNDDPMQSSESKSGLPGQIEDSQESIDQGVSYLAQAIKKADQKDCDIWTAVQAYNFGLDYIDYVAENGKKNSLEIAEKYSSTVLAPQLGNEEQSRYRYLNLRAFFYNGGYLYHNGGNFYYAQLVKNNE